MSTIVQKTESQLRLAIEKAVQAAVSAGELPNEALPPFAVETPADRTHGDLAVNAAMVSARAFKKAPRQIAEAIAAHLELDGTALSRVEVAGPGFLNFFLADSYYGDAVKEVLAEGDNYGRSNYGEGKKVMVEYVSANPTGPMHMGNARGGALGDCLASVLDAAGYEVSREFYVNDAGNQIEKFALSLEVRYLQLYKGEEAIVMPEDAYHGDDIREHAKGFAAKYGDSFVNAEERERRDALVAYALPLNIDKMHRDMAKYRIEYDRWFHESVLHQNGELQEVIDLLTERGLTYEKDGALWYRAGEHGEKYQGKKHTNRDGVEEGIKDEVLVRANGNPTYFAADIAYHRNKFARGFDTCIDVWGADHHGHVARMKGAMDAIGLDGNKLQIVLIQLVRLMRDGEVVRMSKRSGKPFSWRTCSTKCRSMPPVSSSTCAKRLPKWTSTSAWPLRNPPPTPCTTCNTPTHVCAPSSARWRRTVSRFPPRRTSNSSCCKRARSATSSVISPPILVRSFRVPRTKTLRG